MASTGHGSIQSAQPMHSLSVIFATFLPAYVSQSSAREVAGMPKHSESADSVALPPGGQRLIGAWFCDKAVA